VKKKKKEKKHTQAECSKHADQPRTAKVRSPSVERRVAGTVKSAEKELYMTELICADSQACSQRGYMGDAGAVPRGCSVTLRA